MKYISSLNNLYFNIYYVDSCNVRIHKTNGEEKIKIKNTISELYLKKDTIKIIKNNNFRVIINGRTNKFFISVGKYLPKLNLIALNRRFLYLENINSLAYRDLWKVKIRAE